MLPLCSAVSSALAPLEQAAPAGAALQPASTAPHVEAYTTTGWHEERVSFASAAAACLGSAANPVNGSQSKTRSSTSLVAWDGTMPNAFKSKFMDFGDCSSRIDVPDGLVDAVSHQTRPHIIIAGLGDSGTRGVRDLMDAVGVGMCSCTNPSMDNNLSFPVHDCVDNLLAGGNGVVSMKAFMKAEEPWERTLRAMKASMLLTGECARRTSRRASPHSVWGYKSQRHIYLVPVIQHALASLSGPRTLMLLVSRDPRDICTGKVHGAAGAETEMLGRAYGYDGSSCLGWYSAMWTSMLPELGGDAFQDSAAASLAIVRIEDLVVPVPEKGSTSEHILKCIMRRVHLAPSHRKKIQGGLAMMHAYRTSYLGMGGHGNERHLTNIGNGVESHTEMHGVMQQLGYKVDEYGLDEPASARVITPECKGENMRRHIKN